MIKLKYSHFNYVWLGVGALFFVSPLLSLPLILYGIYHQKKSAYFFFSVFIGILAWLQIPIADLYQHTLIAEHLSKNSIGAIFDREDSDFIIYGLSWIVLNMGLPYQTVRFLTAFESFFILTLILRYMLINSEKLYSQKEAFIRFILLFLFYELIQTVSGTRYGVASYNYIFALHMWFNRRNYSGFILFILIAVFTHEAYLYFAPLSLIAIISCRNRSSAIVIMIICMITILPFINYFSDSLGRRSEFYFAGGKALGEAQQDTTIIGGILFYGCRIFMLPLIYIVLKYFNRRLMWSRAVLVWSAFLFATIVNLTLIFRFALLIQVIGIFALMQIESYYKISRKIITVLITCGVCLSLFNGVNHRTYIYNSRYQYTILPIPLILNYKYEIPWIKYHIKGGTIIHDTYK